MLRQWCSLSLFHRTCENMHGGVGLGRLSMPNGWCTMHMPIYFNPWGIKKYSVPYMVQIELTYIPIKCGIVNPHVDGFLNSLAMPWSCLPIIWKLSCVVVWAVMQM